MNREAAIETFGPEPEMQITSRVAAWEAPHRVLLDGSEGVEGLKFEWSVEPLDDNTCTVRLHNAGFDDDPQYEAMIDGWKLFMANLQRHLEHFAGRIATSALPMVMWQVTPNVGRAILAGGLAIDEMSAVGDRSEVTADDVARLAGTVMDTDPVGSLCWWTNQRRERHSSHLKTTANSQWPRSGCTSTDPTVPKRRDETTPAGASDLPNSLRLPADRQGAQDNSIGVHLSRCGGASFSGP